MGSSAAIASPSSAIQKSARRQRAHLDKLIALRCGELTSIYFSKPFGKHRALFHMGSSEVPFLRQEWSTFEFMDYAKLPHLWH